MSDVNLDVGPYLVAGFCIYVGIPLMIWFLGAILTGRFRKKWSDKKSRNIVRLIAAINAIALLAVAAITFIADLRIPVSEYLLGYSFLSFEIFLVIFIFSFGFYKLSISKRLH